MKNAFDELNRLDVAEEWVVDITQEISKSEKQREERMKKNKIFENCRNTIKGVIYT